MVVSSRERACGTHSGTQTNHPLVMDDPATGRSPWSRLFTIGGRHFSQSVVATFWNQWSRLFGICSLRTWVEYGFKDDLGWADYRVTDAASIERWWELVMSAYTLVSLQQLVGAAQSTARAPTAAP